MTADEIRSRFLQFFARRGHTVVPSSSLVPADDPTLLFTNAGMNQFKDVILGREQRSYRRAVSVQKCVRAGGKHNDLETVGRTARHGTFFEMLGNWSFGDYFKREAIGLAWEFVTVELGFPRDRLWVTVFRDDDEAHQLWQDVAGMPPERIVRLDEKDNFWEMADTGPCGPDTELFLDRGAEYSCGPDCGIGRCECDRFQEFWNLVFIQYDRGADGSLAPLDAPTVDTGMGLERVTAILNDKPSIFETDLIMPIIRRVEATVGGQY
ncbi:MAG: alanine--tRNA ligase-related protein, partial [Clostridia bacterium]